jgi:hypothetical protein
MKDRQPWEVKDVRIFQGHLLMLIKSVTSTRKERQRYFYFKNLVSVIVAVLVFVNVGGLPGAVLAIIAALISNFTISPIVAFLICLCEQILP